MLIKVSIHGKASVCSWKQLRNNHCNCSILSKDQSRALKVKAIDGLTQATKNTDELEEAVNTDLKSKKEKLTNAELLRRSVVFSWSSQVDAAA